MATACRPRQALTVSQWADAHRVLSQKASSEPGPWRTARVPYLREIMDCLSVRSPVQHLVFMKSAQTAGTEAALNWIGYIIDHAPAPALVVVPTLEVRKRWVRQRLNTMLTETPALADIFDARRKRDATNAEDIKDFPGGMLVIGGANSPASLASMPICYVVNDEVDRFPWEVGVEGDPMGLISERQKTFVRRRKRFDISSPTIKGASRIDDLYEQSDQRRYHMPCPHCESPIAFKWENLRWTVDPQTRAVTRAVYVCEHCGAEIEEHHKTRMLERGRWVARRPGAPIRGYHINGLYAPLGLGYRWVEIVQEWLAAQGDHAKLKRFINTTLGECWEDRSHDVRPNVLMERAEPYGVREIPPGCLILTCGVDVQKDRMSFQVLGWGRGEVCWVIDWLEIPGNPSRMLEQGARGEGPVIEYLRRPFVNCRARELHIEATAIDTGGHHTHEVYNFVRSRQARRLMAVKGASTPGKPILGARPQAQDVNWRGRVIKGGVLLWLIGSDTAKHALYARLTGDENLDPAARKIHFPNDLPADYFDQITAEVFDPERNRWVKRRGRRNEGTDTWVYGTAAGQHPELRVHALRARDWARLAQMLEPEEKSEAGEPPPAARPPAPTPPKPRRGGFVGGWRR